MDGYLVPLWREPTNLIDLAFEFGPRLVLTPGWDEAPPDALKAIAIVRPPETDAKDYRLSHAGLLLPIDPSERLIRPIMDRVIGGESIYSAHPMSRTFRRGETIRFSTRGSKPIEISGLESFTVEIPMPPLPHGQFTAFCQCGSRTEESEAVYAGEVPFICVVCSEELRWSFDR